MSDTSAPGSASPILGIDIDGPIARLTMARPEKRNAICEALLPTLETFYTSPPEFSARAGPDWFWRTLLRRAGSVGTCAPRGRDEPLPRPGLASGDGADPVRRPDDGHGALWRGHRRRTGAGGSQACAHRRPFDHLPIGGSPQGHVCGRRHHHGAGRIPGADRTTEMMLIGREYGPADGLRPGLALFARCPKTLALAPGALCINVPVGCGLPTQRADLLARCHADTHPTVVPLTGAN